METLTPYAREARVFAWSVIVFGLGTAALWILQADATTHVASYVGVSNVVREAARWLGWTVTYPMACLGAVLIAVKLILIAAFTVRNGDLVRRLGAFLAAFWFAMSFSSFYAVQHHLRGASGAGVTISLTLTAANFAASQILSIAGRKR